MKGCNFFISSVNTCSSVFLIIAILEDMKCYLIVVLIIIFLMTNDIEHLFICLLAIGAFSLLTWLFRSFCCAVFNILDSFPFSLSHKTFVGQVEQRSVYFLHLHSFGDFLLPFASTSDSFDWSASGSPAFGMVVLSRLRFRFLVWLGQSASLWAEALSWASQFWPMRVN